MNWNIQWDNTVMIKILQFLYSLFSCQVIYFSIGLIFFWLFKIDSFPLDTVHHAFAGSSHEGLKPIMRPAQEWRGHSVELLRVGKEEQDNTSAVDFPQWLSVVPCVWHSVTVNTWLDELYIFQIADSRNDLRMFDNSRNNSTFSATVSNLTMPVSQKVSAHFSPKWDKEGSLWNWLRKSFSVNHTVILKPQ